jgi:hypothetical protein
VYKHKLSELRELRARRPAYIVEAAASRQRRPLLGDDGRLVIAAADHPARGALAVGQNPLAMANRDDLLTRLVTALSRPGVDGVLATADILEDLLLLGVLDNKIVIGSMNRGGLLGSAFELDDRFTAYDVHWIEKMKFDGGKMLCRISLEDAATGSTLESCGKAVTALAESGLMALVEPFVSRFENGRLRNVLTTEAVIRSVVVSSGLGATSAYTWLKLPVVDDMHEVMAATTLPTLLLGGDGVASPDETFEAWSAALRLPGVRGLVVGRRLLYPPDGDVSGNVDLTVGLVRTCEASLVP